jgi:cell division protein FtsB
MAVLGLVGVLMLAVFPARALVAQHAERRQLAGNIRDLHARNQSLEGRAAALQTDTEIERLARQHYNLVRPGEEVFDIVVPDPPAVAPKAAPRPADDPGWARRLVTRLTDVF